MKRREEEGRKGGRGETEKREREERTETERERKAREDLLLTYSLNTYISQDCTRLKLGACSFGAL